MINVEVVDAVFTEVYYVLACRSYCIAVVYWCVLEGQFGSYMQVGIQNDGPVTITLDTSSSVCMHTVCCRHSISSSLHV